MSLSTLIDDIYGIFDKTVDINPQDVKALGEDIARIVSEQFQQGRRSLRLSNLSSPCRRQLWYSINCSELAEKLHGSVRIKFIIGHITEAVILFLAKLAGHAVTDQQKEVDLHGVPGHIDALLDGELVDVKSASPYSFTKFKHGLTPDQDSFGYLGQLHNYAKTLGKDRGYFIAVDKVLGHLCLDGHTFPNRDLLPVVTEVKAILESNEPPPRGFTDEPDGASGNRKLGVNCSYCLFKDTCWPNLQVYAYSQGPRYLTRVVREPKVDRVQG